MRREIVGGVLAALLSCGALAQSKASDVSKKTSEAWQAMKAYTVDRKKDAEAYGKDLVRQADREISDLEKRAARASGEARVQLESELKDLKAKRALAAKKLEQMGKAGAGAWDDAKDGFADAYRDLQASYQKAVKKFK